MTTGASNSTKERPSLPAKERGGPLRFQYVISLSSHTNKEPPASSPCGHHRPERRYAATPSSHGMPFNSGAQPDGGLALVDPVGPGAMVVGLVASMAAVDQDF
jgi:hypothetical protein